MITTIVGIFAAVGVVLGGLELIAGSRARIKWWAIPLLCIFGLLSMPMSISVSLYPGICKAAGGVYLSPWIIELWRSWGYLLGFGWIIAIAIIFLGKGIRFSCPLRQRLGLLIPVTLLCLTATFDTVLFLGFRNFDTSSIVVESVSPDGTRRILCEEDNWLDTSFSFILIANSKRPITCRRLPGVGYEGNPDGERRITWSADSQLMCLWIANTPACMYDFTDSESFKPRTSWGNGITREQAEAEGKAEFSKLVSTKFDGHGGVAK